jgi:hypothetical protein
MLCYLLVKVVDSVSLLSHDVVETVCRVGVDQAVPDPLCRFHAANIGSITLKGKNERMYLLFGKFGNQIKRLFYTFIANLDTGV